MLILSLALTPVLIIILFVYFQDKYSREPTLTLFVAFLLGILSVIPAALIENIYEWTINLKASENILVTIIYAFIGVGLTEEFCKFIFLRWYIYKNKNFTEPMDGVVYAVMVSMGFAALENLFYVFIFSDDPIGTAIARSLTAVPAHACFGVIMGLYFGYARFTFMKKRVRLLTKAVVFASIAHGIYNVFLFIGCPYCPILSLISLVIFIIISLRIISRFKRISPFKKKYILITHKKRIVTTEELARNEARKAELRKKLPHVLKRKKKVKPDDTSYRADS
jgi:RsiW-degrading membrane proteinase PrsW (M82 family)